MDDLEPAHRRRIGIDIDPHRLKASGEEGDSLLRGEECLVVIDARLTPGGHEEDEDGPTADLRGGFRLGEIGMPGDGGGGDDRHPHRQKRDGGGPDHRVERVERPSLNVGCHGHGLGAEGHLKRGRSLRWSLSVDLVGGIASIFRVGGNGPAVPPQISPVALSKPPEGCSVRGREPRLDIFGRGPDTSAIDCVLGLHPVWRVFAGAW